MASTIINPQLVSTETMKIKIELQGKSLGRTLESEQGDLMEVALDARRDEVEKLILELAKR